MQFTDRFGSPLAVGDKIVIAICAGRSSAELKETEIRAIIPLVPHRDLTEPRKEKSYDNQRKEWVETGNIAGFHYMRADQDQHVRPTDFYRPADTPPEKLFVLQYQQYGYFGPDKGKPTRKQAFDRVNDVVKVPDGV